MSQSLSSRAMSFDQSNKSIFNKSNRVSIPFEQGDVFRPMWFPKRKLTRSSSQSLSSRAMSFDGQNVVVTKAYYLSQSLSSRAMSFDCVNVVKQAPMAGLNPFRAGRCLSTYRRIHYGTYIERSQSLSSRAMSFD